MTAKTIYHEGTTDTSAVGRCVSGESMRKYCKKHRQYHESSNGCLLCRMEICPHCKRPSLFINKDWNYECLNPECGWAFRESDKPHWQPTLGSAWYGTFMGDESWTAQLEGSPNITRGGKGTSLLGIVRQVLRVLFR